MKEKRFTRCLAAAALVICALAFASCDYWNEEWFKSQGGTPEENVELDWGDFWVGSVMWVLDGRSYNGHYANGTWGYWDANSNFYGEIVFWNTSSDEGIALSVLEPAGGSGVTIQPAVLDSRRIVTLPGTNYYGDVSYGADADNPHAYVVIVDGANPPPTVKIKVTATGETGPESCTLTGVYHPAGSGMHSSAHYAFDAKVERGR